MKINLNLPGPADMIRIGVRNESIHGIDHAFAPLKIALQALADINAWLLRHRQFPSIYNGRIKYVAEAPNKEDWYTVEDIHRLGYGDCEDLACARAAEYVVQGVQANPDCSAKWIGSILLIHIFVRFPDGRIEDPSKKLGMKGDG